MADDGFHEIQLNKKQLIFLFMSAAVVLVVAFLCGVLVGRGVRAQADAQAANTTATLPAAEPPEEDAGPAAKVETPPPGAPPSQPPDEGLSYQAKLEDRAPAAETQKAAAAPGKPQSEAATPQPEPPKAAAEKAAAPATPPPPARAADSPAQPANGAGYLVQVVALRGRSDAEALARRLTGKGYKASVMPPGRRGARVYRVVVGRFKSRQEAEEAKRRLEKEEQFKPWITS